MRALIHQLAAAQKQDAVGPVNLAQAVRDQERGFRFCASRGLRG